MCIIGYSGGGGCMVAHKLSDQAHLASQLSSHLYQSTYKIWKQSDKDVLSYLENDEMSADSRLVLIQVRQYKYSWNVLLVQKHDPR